MSATSRRQAARIGASGTESEPGTVGAPPTMPVVHRITRGPEQLTVVCGDAAEAPDSGTKAARGNNRYPIASTPRAQERIRSE